jgi:hypothetical protein
MQEAKTRIPGTDMIRNSFRAVKKTVTATGQARFDAEHDSKYGHSDHWWSFCMAENAASLPTHDLLELYKEQYEKIKAGQQLREPGTPEQEFQRQANAQMEQARKADFKISGVFGAPVNKVASSSASKPKVVASTPKCPQCQNPNLTRARAAGISGDFEENCNSCGWSQVLPRI